MITSQPQAQSQAQTKVPVSQANEDPAVEQDAVVAYEAPVFLVNELDPQYKSQLKQIEILPTNSVFYDWKTLMVRPFMVPDLEGFDRAEREDSEELIVQIIGGCIDKPILDLTLGDYKFLLYWLRLNSYTRSPLIVTWFCPACARRNNHSPDNPAAHPANERVTRLNGTTIDYVSVEPEDIVDMDRELLDPPRVRHYLEFLRWKKEENPSPERLKTAQIALYLNKPTFKERLDYLKTASVDVYELARACQIMLEPHGPSETVKTRCDHQECYEGGATYTLPLVCRPTRFLSPV